MTPDSQESRKTACSIAGERGARHTALSESNKTTISTPSTPFSETPPAVSSAHVPEELTEEPADTKPLHAQQGTTRPVGDSPTAPRSSESDRHFTHAEHSAEHSIATGDEQSSGTIIEDRNSNTGTGDEKIDSADLPNHAALQRPMRALNEKIDPADLSNHAALRSAMKMSIEKTDPADLSNPAGFSSSDNLSSYPEIADTSDDRDHPDTSGPADPSAGRAAQPSPSTTPTAAMPRRLSSTGSAQPSPSTTPTADIAGRIHAAIYALGHELGRQLADSLENELTMGQFAFLQFIKRHEDITLSEIASELGIKPSAVTAMIDRLERRGYVTRLRAVAEDRRVVRVYLTDAGRAILSRCELKRREIVNDLLSALEPEEIDQLISILEKVEARSRARVTSAGTSEGCGESQEAPARSRRNRRRSSRTTAADITPPHGTQPSPSTSRGKASHASNPPPATSRARKRAP
jgi:DNA-binding MarR family transcriptional regulator